MKRSRPPRPRVKLNRDAAWELLDRQGMSRKNPARRSGLSSEYLFLSVPHRRPTRQPRLCHLRAGQATQLHHGDSSPQHRQGGHREQEHMLR